MADAITGITEISATSMEVISQMAQTYLQQESVLLPTVTNYTSLVVKGASSVSIPRGPGFTVNSKGENVAADATTITYGKDSIDLDNHRYIQFIIEDIANRQARISVVQENVLRASKDLAVDVDSYILEELKLASAAAPDHQLNFIDTVTDVVSKEDVLAARKLLQEQYLNPKECYLLVGPEKESELLNIDNFISAEKYGSSEGIQNGEIGKIYGLKTLVSTVAADAMYIYHPSAVGFAFQKTMTFAQESDLANIGTRYSLDMIHGTKVMDSGKRNVYTDSTN